MKIKNFKAFTLIEFMVAISIFFILSIITYAPYNYYTKKAKVRLTGKEISQVLHEARNMAINGVINSTNNLSIGVYLDTSNNNKLQILSYPWTYTGSQIVTTIGGDIKLLKSYDLEKGIQIDEIESKNNLLFFFQAITGKVSYLTNNAGSMVVLNGPHIDEIDIKYSYKGSTSINLKGIITYYTKTNAVDY